MNYFLRIFGSSWAHCWGLYLQGLGPWYWDRSKTTWQRFSRETAVSTSINYSCFFLDWKNCYFLNQNDRTIDMKSFLVKTSVLFSIHYNRRFALLCWEVRESQVVNIARNKTKTKWRAVVNFWFWCLLSESEYLLKDFR